MTCVTSTPRKYGRTRSACGGITDSGRISSSASRAVQGLAPETMSGSASAVSVQPSVKPARKSYVLVVAGVALLAAKFVAYHFWSRASTPSGPAKITQISQWNKLMNSARLSPDGHAIAFNSPVGGIAQVFLMLTSGGEPLQLTHDEGDKYVDDFSPNGKEIYYWRNLGRDEVWAVPTLGGAPRRVLSGWHAVPSPYGAFIYYAKTDNTGIFRADNYGLNEELVYSSEGGGLQFLPLLLFPGRNNLLAISSQIGASTVHFYKINVSSHEAIDLGEVSGNTSTSGIVWAEPGETVLVSRSVNGLTNIWNYNLQDRSLKQITAGAGPDYRPMPDPEGKGIYFVNGKTSGFLTAYHVHSKELADVVAEDATAPNISPDGRRLMYVTHPAPQRHELWVSDIDGANKLKIAAGERMDIGTWAPDNFHLLFLQAPAGEGFKSYIVAADGSDLRQLPRMGDNIGTTVWGHDQKSIDATSREDTSSIPTVWKWSIDSSKPEKIAENCGFVFDGDLDGRYLFAVVLEGQRTGIYEISISDGRCISLLPGAVTFGFALARDGQSFLYAVASGGEATIYRQLGKEGKTIGTPQSAVKVPFAFPLAYGSNGYDFSRDLSTVVYARPGGHQDLYLLSQK